jgi:hypothetical protein
MSLTRFIPLFGFALLAACGSGQGTAERQGPEDEDNDEEA